MFGSSRCGLTGVDGTHRVVEAVGHLEAFEMSLGGGACRGNAISGVGVPHCRDAPLGREVFLREVTGTGGIAPARHDNEQLLPDAMEEPIEPGKVFDRTSARR